MDAQQHMRNIEENGYTVVEGVLTEEECDFYVNLLEHDYQQHAKYYAGSNATSHGLNDKGHEKVVYNMHNKHIGYYDLFDHPKVFPIIKTVLEMGSYNNSEQVNLLNISARNPAPYAPAQQLHLDSNLPGRDSYPLILVALYMLEDFTENNGATRFLPGSHKFSGYAEDNVEYPEEVTITGKKGSVIIFNGSLWHGSSKKKDDTSRWAIILGYGRWFIKPSFDFVRNIPENIFNQLTEERKNILGLNTAPPLDEFTRCTRRSTTAEWEEGYELPNS